MGNWEKSKIKDLARKNRQLIVYLFCSFVTSLGEMGLGWLILKALPERILIANTVSLIVGALVHYYLVTKYAFRVRHSIVRAGAYAGTFLLGLLIQDAVVLLMYRFLLEHLPEGWQYVLSKTASMAAALVITYIMRDWLNRKIIKISQKNGNESKTEEKRP